MKAHKMRVLVTGGAGFIGSNLAKKCVELGWTTDVVDDFSAGKHDFLPDGVNFVYNEDFASKNMLVRIASKVYDYIFHLAALPRVSYSVEYPVETNNVNVTSTLKVLDALKKGGVKRFVFASSSSVYGGSDILPTSESMNKSPKSPYALQKSIIEDYLKMYSEYYNLDCISLRYFNVFGPNQLGNSPYATAISSWLTAIHSGKQLRSDGDGSQSRDMCYVDNVVHANILAATNEKKFRGETFNVACGDRTTNLEILNYLKERYPTAQVLDAPWRAGDVMHTQADISNIKEAIGYEPLVKFWDGLNKTIEWAETSTVFKKYL